MNVLKCLGGKSKGQGVAQIPRPERTYCDIDPSGKVVCRKLTDYETKLEDEIENLQNALFTLTTHYARIQFHLRQITMASECERSRLLNELEKMSTRGVDADEYDDAKDMPGLACDARSLGDVRVKQRSLIWDLRNQLDDLQSSANCFDTGDGNRCFSMFDRCAFDNDGEEDELRPCCRCIVSRQNRPCGLDDIDDIYEREQKEMERRNKQNYYRQSWDLDETPEDTSEFNTYDYDEKEERDRGYGEGKRKKRKKKKGIKRTRGTSKVKDQDKLCDRRSLCVCSNSRGQDRTKPVSRNYKRDAGKSPNKGSSPFSSDNNRSPTRNRSSLQGKSGPSPCCRCASSTSYNEPSSKRGSLTDNNRSSTGRRGSLRVSIDQTPSDLRSAKSGQTPSSKRGSLTDSNEYSASPRRGSNGTKPPPTTPVFTDNSETTYVSKTSSSKNYNEIRVPTVHGPTCQCCMCERRLQDFSNDYTMEGAPRRSLPTGQTLYRNPISIVEARTYSDAKMAQWEKEQQQEQEQEQEQPDPMYNTRDSYNEPRHSSGDEKRMKKLQEQRMKQEAKKLEKERANRRKEEKRLEEDERRLQQEEFSKPAEKKRWSQRPSTVTEDDTSNWRENEKSKQNRYQTPIATTSKSSSEADRQHESYYTEPSSETDQKIPRRNSYQKPTKSQEKKFDDSECDPRESQRPIITRRSCPYRHPNEIAVGCIPSENTDSRDQLTIPIVEIEKLMSLQENDEWISDEENSYPNRNFN